MPLRHDELLKAADIVADSREMVASVKCSLLGAAITSVVTFCGGLVAGPIGLLAGATSGGILAYCSTKDKFKPVSRIVKEDLTEAQKQRLIHHLEMALKDLDITDVVGIAMLLSGNNRAFLVIFNVIKNFIEGDLGMTLMYNNSNKIQN